MKSYINNDNHVQIAFGWHQVTRLQRTEPIPIFFLFSPVGLCASCRNRAFAGRTKPVVLHRSPFFFPIRIYFLNINTV